MTISESLRSELSCALRNNDGQLGKVFALLEEGKTTNRELVEGGAAANQGAAANLRVTVNAILNGVMPNAPTVAAQSRRSIGGILRHNPVLSQDACGYLESLRIELEQISDNETAVSKEEAELERASEKLEKSVENLPGVYVYTLPTFYRTTQKTDPDRYWFKVGKTDRPTRVRLGEHQRATGLPEDSWLLRVYRLEAMTPHELEQEFHKMLKAAGHARATGKYSGHEWFATNLEFLDTIAGILGCAIVEADIPVQ